MRTVEDGKGLTDYWGAYTKLREIGLDCALAVGIVIKLTPRREAASLIREFIGVIPPYDDSGEPKIVAVIHQRPTGDWNVDKRTKIIERTFLDHPFTTNDTISTSLYSFMKQALESREAE